jgi:hypothetical protein
VSVLLPTILPASLHRLLSCSRLATQLIQLNVCVSLFYRALLLDLDGSELASHASGCYIKLSINATFDGQTPECIFSTFS